MGSYVFARLDDMFEFFRSDGRFGQSQNIQLFINPGYWGEKVSAVDADYVYEQGKSGRLEEFSAEKFRRELIGHLVQWLRDFRAETTKGERRRLWNAVMDELIHPLRVIAPGWGEHMLDAAIRFSHPVNDLVGIYSPGDHLMHVSVAGFTRRFIWACYAIAWGIAQYDQEKEAGAPSERPRVDAAAEITAACGECGKDGRKQGAAEFMRVTERLLSLIEESPEMLARVESAMRQAEGEMAEELRAAVVDRDFLNRRYTL